MTYSAGIDLGTSGVRCCVIDEAHNIVAESRTPGNPTTSPHPGWSQQEPEAWWTQVCHCLQQLPPDIRRKLSQLAVDGTSSTLLLSDPTGTPLTPALMYNDTRATAEAQRISTIAPAESAAHGASSSLAKLLWLLKNTHPNHPAHALHQADWINGRLSDCWSISDYNNALKLGYDPINLCWPQWIHQLGCDTTLLPHVVAPGSDIGTIHPAVAQTLGLPTNLKILTGTTDSTAAFIATGATQPGDAVTSIGSTLVMKIISEKPTFTPEYGVYSHRLGKRWLVGGASNTGGAVLRKYFTIEQIETLSRKINPRKDTGLDLYPLLEPGERFPISDPNLKPRIPPAENLKPEIFLQALLEGIANIEATAYQRLHELGTPYPKQVLTAGGGAKNDVWTAIRARKLGVQVTTPEHTEAAYGTALIGKRSF